MNSTAKRLKLRPQPVNIIYKRPDNYNKNNGLLMSKGLRKLLLMLAGQPGLHLISALILLSVFALYKQINLLSIEIITGLSVIRLLYSLLANPKPILVVHRIRKKVLNVIEDELKITLALGAMAFALKWTIDPEIIFIYGAVSMWYHIFWMMATKKILKYLSGKLEKSGYTPSQRKVIIVGTGQRGKKAADVIKNSPELETNLLGFVDYRKDYLWRYRDIPLIGHPDEIEKIISSNQVDAIIVAVEPEDLSKTRKMFDTAEVMGVPVCFMAEIFEPKISEVKPSFINGTPVYLYRATSENQIALLAKAVMDKVGAVIGLILTSPIFIACAVAIKLDSKGPIFFKQTRSGLNGKPFKLLKFRTMGNDAEKKKQELEKMNEMSGPVFKIKNDPRVTRIGRLLRKTSMDELPQFINVLLGDMSLVGPRPPLPKEVAKYEDWQRRRLSVKPGVTCTWQVSGRNNIDFDQWMKLDLEYIDNWSIWDDTKIIVRTIPAVVKGSGAS